MNPFQSGRFLLTAAVLLILVGCAHTGTYNAGYLAAARRPAAVPSEGRVLVVTTEQEDAYVYSGHPTSFTGAATTLTVPLGIILKEATIAAFADAFHGGAEASSSVHDADRFVAVVSPHPVSFTYEYNQLKNVGFAITPTAVVSIDVRVLDGANATRWHKVYASGPVEGPSYMLNTSPQEEIVKVTHKAAYDLMAKAAVDVSAEVVANRTAPAAPEAK
ncbi:MAG: hypothetical protein U1E63_10750 [Burkholderiales bacterium]